MTTKETEGYELAKGAMRHIAECVVIGFILVNAYGFMRLAWGWGMDDTDKDKWNRSGLTIKRDAKTGVEYLSDGHGGLVRRESR